MAVAVVVAVVVVGVVGVVVVVALQFEVVLVLPPGKQLPPPKALHETADFGQGNKFHLDTL